MDSEVHEKEAVLFGGRSKMEKLVNSLDDVEKDDIFFPGINAPNIIFKDS